MATTIQVVLQSDMPNLGKSGELVRVRPGYARNFLIPRALAAPATARNVARIEHEQRAGAAKAAKVKAEANTEAAKIATLTVSIARKVGDDGRLFGSVTAKDIANALAEKGVTIDKKKIVLAEALKALGAFDVGVRLAADVTTTFKVEVVAAATK